MRVLGMNAHETDPTAIPMSAITVPIDQEARNDIAALAALMREHQAICNLRENQATALDKERAKRQELFEKTLVEKVESIAETTRGIRTGYDMAYQDVSERLSKDTNTLGNAISNVNETLNVRQTAHETSVEEKIDKVNDKFWALAVSGLGVVGAGFVATLALAWDFFLKLIKGH